MTATPAEQDRAHRLGTLAGRARRGLGGACPYDANGTPDERGLALVFVRAYIDAGGVVDGIDFGDGSAAATRAPRSTAAGGGGRRDGGAFGHLGLPL